MSTFGTNNSIKTEQPDRIRIVEKAEYDNSCLPYCMDATRTYFYTLENGYTYNTPTACCSIPPNCLCPGEDHIYQTYFDRGLFDRQSCYWKIGYFNGESVIVPNDIKYVCFCQECTLCSCNGWGILAPCFWLCGVDIPDRIRFLPYEYCCFCCPTRSCFLWNCCGLCGPKDGEPLVFCLVPFISPFHNNQFIEPCAGFKALCCGIDFCLKKGTAESLALSLNNAKAEWKRRNDMF